VYHQFQDARISTTAPPSLMTSRYGLVLLKGQSSDRKASLNTPRTSRVCSRNTSSITTYLPTTCKGCRAALHHPFRRCRDCGACFSPSKLGCVDRFRTNKARPHIKNLSIMLFIMLCRLRSIRKLLGRDVTIQLVCGLVNSRLNYCNIVLVGLPVSTFYMRPPVSWTTRRRPITWHRRWWIFTGCLSSSASTINCVATFTTYPFVMPMLTYPICWPLVPTSRQLPGCGHHPAVIMSSRGRGWSLAKGRSLSLPLSHGTNFHVNSKKSKCTTTFKRLLKTFLFESAYFLNRLCNVSPVY